MTSPARSGAGLPPGLVGILGGGTMGAGIAQSFAALGSAVVVVESGATAVTAARDRIASALTRAAERGTLSEPPDQVAGRITVIDGTGGLPAGAALVVEALPEDPALKVRLLLETERAVSPGTVVASNTSSLSITELGSAMADPERFVGMHFFNPVPASLLVEVVVAPRTSAQAVHAAVGWTRALGKTEIVVKDSPGFASSRLGIALGLEAIRMAEEGVAEPEDIDNAMILGYKHPMGPLRLTDLVGLDVRLAIAEYLHAKLGERFAPPGLLREKVARGELGRKSGQGFYRWP
jgi:3-hydroxybutyryl-CoA dehydrogenase